MRVGIDLDGVCYDFGASVREYLVQTGARQRHECPDPQRWEFYLDWGLTLPQFLATCHAGVDEGVIFDHGDPFPGTREAIEKIKAAGHTIHIVTDRFFGKWGGSQMATIGWLNRHNIPYDSLTFSADKALVNLDAMVDDRPENYDALDAVGVNVYMLDRPWNAHHYGRRVYSLAQYAQELS